jgi:hypothetical protein
MEESYSCEADGRSASLKIPPSSMEPECSLQCSQEVATGPYPERHKSSPYPYSLEL